MEFKHSGVRVGLKMTGDYHDYPNATSTGGEDGFLTVRMEDEKHETVLAVYAPGEWSYVKYILS